MIPDAQLKRWVDGDFSDARWRAFLRGAVVPFRHDPTPDRLLSFDEVRSKLGASNRVYLGVQTVAVEKIVGSVDRYVDFDRNFLPLRRSLGERWKRIDELMYRSGALPPVELYKVGDAYFVLDGHHRVSVARYHGVPTVEALVTELRREPLAPDAEAGIFADVQALWEVA